MRHSSAVAEADVVTVGRARSSALSNCSRKQTTSEHGNDGDGFTRLERGIHQRIRGRETFLSPYVIVSAHRASAYLWT